MGPKQENWRPRMTVFFGSAASDAHSRSRQFRFRRQQRRRSRDFESGLATRGEYLQGIPILLPAGRHDAEHSFDESAASLTVGSVAALAPQHRMTQTYVQHCCWSVRFLGSRRASIGTILASAVCGTCPTRFFPVGRFGGARLIAG